MNEEHGEHVARETSQGNKIVWGMLPVWCAVAALAMLLYFYFPAPWVAMSMVVIAIVAAGIILARGTFQSRRRG